MSFFVLVRTTVTETGLAGVLGVTKATGGTMTGFGGSNAAGIGVGGMAGGVGLHSAANNAASFCLTLPTAYEWVLRNARTIGTVATAFSKKPAP